MSSPSSLFGVVDIGSSSVRMMIFDTASSPPAQVLNEKIFCPLGQDLDRTGRLHPDSAAEALETLKAYSRMAQDHGVTVLDAVGTAALRDAADGPAFIARARAETGFSIRTISGAEEARYAALGVLSLDPAAAGSVGDFGGGSLEFARIGPGGVQDPVSLPFGAFRVLSMGESAGQSLAEALQKIAPVYEDSPALHAIGGSWRALARACEIDQGRTPGSMQGYSLDASDLTEFCTRVMGLSSEEVRRRYNIEGRRATLVPVSAFVMKRIVTVLKPRKMVISLAGIRDGIVYDYLNSKA